MGTRVVIYEAGPLDGPPTASLLLGRGFEVVPCGQDQALLEEVIGHRPDALVYAMSADCEQDLRLLQLIRRAAPDLPLVLLAADESIATRRQVLDLRPIYYAVWPAEAGELHEAVTAAVEKSSRPHPVGPDRTGGR